MRKNLIFNSILALSAGAFVFIAFYNMPMVYIHMISEDSFGEYFTSTAYFVSFIIMLIIIKIDPEKRKPAIFVLAAFYFIISMEEISWGQRILNFNTPEAVYLINNQREFNFHNLVFVKHTKLMFAITVSLWSLLLPLIAAKFERIHEITERFHIPVVPLKIVPYFVLSLFFFLLGPLPKSDEINEMFFAMSFLIFSNHLLVLAVNNISVKEKHEGAYLSVSLASALILAIFLGINYPYEADLKRRMLQFASEKYPKYGETENSLTLYKCLLKNPDRDDNLLINYAGFIQKNGEPEKAKIILRDVLSSQQKRIELHPEEPGAHILRGNIYYQLNDYRNFRNEYIKAAEKIQSGLKKKADRTGRIETLCSLSSIYTKIQNHQKGMIYFQEAFELCRNDSEKKRLLAIGRHIFIDSIKYKMHIMESKS